MNTKKKAKKLVKTFKDNQFSPKKIRQLDAYAFETIDPVGNGKNHHYLFHCFEWQNGEGLDIIIDWNYKNKSKQKKLSFNNVEIDGILACLDSLNLLD
jgi:hypothetical protein